VVLTKSRNVISSSSKLDMDLSIVKALKENMESFFKKNVSLQNTIDGMQVEFDKNLELI